nr:ribonuclease H-like domain-containing protein [Tanacetum cinerariifolium]
MSEHINDEHEWTDFIIGNLEVTNEHHDQGFQPSEEDNEFPNNDDDDYASPTRDPPTHSQTPHTPSIHSSEVNSQVTPNILTQSNYQSDNVSIQTTNSPSHFDHTPVRGFRTLNDLYENTEELLLAEDEPKNYKEASSDQKWIDAMKAKLDFINRKNTWKLTTLPKGHKTISLTWVFKTKRDTNRNIIKHKARLVAKGYIQEHGIDFEEVFTPVARMETIRLLLAIASNNKWEAHHLDVKSAFLYRDLKKEVWSTPKQATVALSSCESEFITATPAATQALWLKRLLSKLTHSEEDKVTIRVDNKSAIALMKNPVAKILDVLNLNIQIKIRPQFLTPEKNYEAYLVFTFYDPRKISSMPLYIIIKYKKEGDTLNTYFAQWKTKNKWLMVELFRFVNKDQTTVFEVLLEFLRSYCGSWGIFVEGIEFQPVTLLFYLFIVLSCLIMSVYGFTDDEYEAPVNVTLISRLDASNPLHLHPNDSAALNVISIKLKGTENYHVWSNAMLLALKEKNKTGFIDGSCKRSNVDEVLGRQWDRVNVVVLGWILNSITEELFLGQIFSKRARHVWEELKETYDKVDGSITFNLHYKINTLKQNGFTLADYYHGLNALWKQSSILSIDPLPDVKSAYATISSEEYYRIVSSSMAGTSQRPNTANNAGPRHNNSNVNRKNRSSRLVCIECGYNGHTSDRCFKIIGYPADFGKKKNGQNFNKKINSNNTIGSNTSSGFTDDQISTLISLTKDNTLTGNHVQANMAGIKSQKCYGDW